MNLRILAAVAAVPLFLTACASGPSRTAESNSTTSAPSASSNTRVVKSKDGSFSGEIVGTPAAGSKFAKVQIGMSMAEVQQTVGRTPDRWHTYESGKRWIPFYFGNDARRMQAYYQGEGCLVFADGNAWGGGGGDLIQIEADPSGKCYQP